MSFNAFVSTGEAKYVVYCKDCDWAKKSRKEWSCTYAGWDHDMDHHGSHTTVVEDIEDSNYE